MFKEILNLKNNSLPLMTSVKCKKLKEVQTKNYNPIGRFQKNQIKNKKKPNLLLASMKVFWLPFLFLYLVIFIEVIIFLFVFLNIYSNFKIQIIIGKYQNDNTNIHQSNIKIF